MSAAAFAARPAVEIVSGDAPSVRGHIAADFALLDQAELAVAPRWRAWTATDTAVVLGVANDAASEANLDACRQRGVGVLRRASGGGAVVVGTGTLQAALALPHAFDAAMATLDGAKRLACSLLRDALVAAGAPKDLETHCSGDLLIGGRKVAGVALRRRRTATLLHATVLVDADIAAIANLLRHPSREPQYRRGRSHADFLANLGAIDETALAQRLGELVTPP